MSPLAVEPRLRLDIGIRDLVAGALACVLATDALRQERELLEEWGLPDGIACLSIRSAFDLLLRALALPPGSEVAFSAVTHPDMPRIARAHGLRVVPLDLDPATLAPSAEAVEAAIGPGTRLVVVAHLFGTRVDLDPLARRCAEVGALLVEDCAQTIRGPRDHGCEIADVSLFSFGVIKTATALGGALVRVREPALRQAIRAEQERLPRQARSHHLGRILKCTGLVVVGRPLPYGLMLRVVAILGRDPDAFVNGLVRAFPPASGDESESTQTEELLSRIRRGPSAPLLALVRRRLSRFDMSRLEHRANRGERLVSALPASLVHPGAAARLRTHWVVPIVAPDPEALVWSLRAAGFDAARATSSIEAVAAPADRPDLVPRAAEALLAGIVFVPAPPELARSRLRRLVAALAVAGGTPERRSCRRAEARV